MRGNNKKGCDMSETSTPGTPTQPQTTVGTTNNIDTQPAPNAEGGNKPKTKWPLLVALAVVGVGVIGAAAYMLLKPDKKTTETQLTKVSMHTGWLHQAQFAGFFVAEEK